MDKILKLDWKVYAAKLFRDGEKLVSIAEAVGKNRDTVSDYLKKLPDYHDVRQKRKISVIEKRTESKRMWARKNRGAPAWELVNISVERRHEIDVRVLSAERFR